MKVRVFAVLILAALVGVAAAQSDSAKSIAKGKGKSKATSETVSLKNAQGGDAGSATISGTPGGNGVTIKLNLKGLPAGEHALHLHQVAQCDPPDFKTAGPHFNPDGKKHGLQNPEGPHAGDMSNFTVAQNGTAKTTIKNEHVTISGDAPNALLPKGVALVVHAKPDDMKTDPAGNAGDRIACGVLKQQ
jgi:Cu-Zn family superoxide dismutase